MSQENVEKARRSLEAWQRGDFESWLATIDENVEWHTVLERLVEGVEISYRGLDGMRQMWDRYHTDLEDFQVEAKELRELEDGRVLFLGHLRWRGPASGIEVESPLGMLFTYRGEKLLRSMDFLSHLEALEAVGLSEHSAHADS